MKPPGNAREQFDRLSERKVQPAVTESVSNDAPSVAQLTEHQVSILRCLRQAGDGLTIGQLEYRTACSVAEIRVALDGLLERRLAGRLNTLIPSYFSR